MWLMSCLQLHTVAMNRRCKKSMYRLHVDLEGFNIVVLVQGRRKVVKREEARRASAEGAEWGGVWGRVFPPPAD